MDHPSGGGVTTVSSPTRGSSGPCRAAIVALAVLLAGCARSGGALDPAGRPADRIAGLWWWLFWLGAAVFALVVAALAVALVLGRRHPAESRDRRGRRLVILGGIVLPAAILPALLLLNLDTLDAFGAGEPQGDDIVIDVVGNQWWWEVRYPDLEIVTANELTIPTGRDVLIRLTSDDVIHSFWVPRLHGKADLIPGKITTLRLVASEPGVYVGQCAEYCGLQHALMAFRVVVEPPTAFAAWIERMARPGAEPATPLQRLGRRVFLDSGCASCHRIQGTAADGQLGPDLTHFADRLTIGAGSVPNREGYLAGWVANAQSIKPGVAMPPIKLDPDELHAVVAYLQSLE